jgi:hypothetical protein
MPNETVRAIPWNGQPTGRCDHIDCTNAPVLHVELTSPGSEYAAESDLCAEHLPMLGTQGRMFLVAIGVVKPETGTERNMATTSEEHGL